MHNKKPLFSMRFHQINIVLLISMFCFYSCSEKTEENLNKDIEWRKRNKQHSVFILSTNETIPCQ